MSCGSNHPSAFAPLQNTWSPQSDLTLGKWDPYPELQPAVNCYSGKREFENYKPIRENFNSDCCQNCPNFNVLPQTIQRASAPLLARSFLLANNKVEIISPEMAQLNAARVNMMNGVPANYHGVTRQPSVGVLYNRYS
jgi:hypothetical protein